MELPSKCLRILNEIDTTDKTKHCISIFANICSVSGHVLGMFKLQSLSNLYGFIAEKIRKYLDRTLNFYFDNPNVQKIFFSSN